jgi:hypothetical protein
MTLNELVVGVMKHAKKHYEEDAWDEIVECWTSAEISNELQKQGITEAEKAIEHFGWIAKVRDERRRDIEAEAF